MKQWKSKARIVLCLFVIAAFFLPAYRGQSGYDFVSVLMTSPDFSSELTFTDAIVVILPLLLVPATALMLLVRCVQRIPIRRIYVGLPGLFLVFFTAILLWGERANPALSSLGDLPTNFGVGYFVAFFSCAGLPFTRNRRRRKHRKPKPKDTLPELAV